MTHTLTLNLAISTIGKEGIKRVFSLLPPPIPKVSYVISWQNHEGCVLPETVGERDDVTIIKTDSKGLSANRNNALNHCNGDIVLLSDDDIDYNQGAFNDIIEAFENDPEMDIALFKIDYNNRKQYPDKDLVLSFPYPKFYFPTTPEIAFRKSRIGNLQFWEGLGLNSLEMHSGEEELFIFSAIKRGLKVFFINKEIGKHPHPTSGEKITAEVLKGNGFIIGLTYPFTSVIRIILKAIRLCRNKKAPFIFSIKNLSAGWSKSFLKKISIPQNCRW